MLRAALSAQIAKRAFQGGQVKSDPRHSAVRCRLANTPRIDDAISSSAGR
jgi:hypothetical protein